MDLYFALPTIFVKSQFKIMDKVSVILPVFNEEKIILRTINSLLIQECTGFEIEILVLDGLSTDKTKKIVKSILQEDKRVRYLLNEKRKTPYAFNLGLKEATGNYVAILGAHCEYRKDYLAVCLQELKDEKAAGCSGRVFSKSACDTFESQASAYIFGNKFGVSGNSFRTQPEGFVDTIPYPIFVKKILLDLGGYNTELSRNQDNDMNYRIRAAGHKLYCTYKTFCVYFPKSTLREAYKYAHTNGFWNAESLRESKKSMSLRHFIPFLFVLYLIFWMLMSGLFILNILSSFLYIILSVPLLVYLLLTVIYAFPFIKKSDSLKSIWMPIYFFRFHISYGMGTFKGLFNKQG